MGGSSNSLSIIAATTLASLKGAVVCLFRPSMTELSFLDSGSTVAAEFFN